MSASAHHILLSVIVVLGILVIVVCVPLQRKALNKIAFGRSMFITAMCLLMGFIAGLWPTIPAAILSIALFLLGYGFMILMGTKSYQRLKMQKR